MMKRASMAVVAALLAAPAAHADTLCRAGFNNGTINGNLTVPEGATCDLENEVITGNVKVGRDATLRVNRTTVYGNLSADECAIVQGASDGIVGNVTVQNCTGAAPGFAALFGGFNIGGNFRCQENSSSCHIQFSSVGGNWRLVGILQNLGLRFSHKSFSTLSAAI
jgi:hypothetical protein